MSNSVKQAKPNYNDKVFLSEDKRKYLMSFLFSDHNIMSIIVIYNH